MNDLGNIMLSGINQTQKDKCCLIAQYMLPIIVKFAETESKMIVSSSWWKEAKGNYYLMGTEFQFRMIRKKLWI